MIEVTGLTKSLSGGDRTLPVLNGIDLVVPTGTSTAILGRSGSGKSTLLSLLALFDRADEGRYLLNGQDVTRISEAEACRLRSQVFGFVFQRFFLLKDLTAEGERCREPAQRQGPGPTPGPSQAGP